MTANKVGPKNADSNSMIVFQNSRHSEFVNCSLRSIYGAHLEADIYIYKTLTYGQQRQNNSHYINILFHVPITNMEG